MPRFDVLADYHQVIVCDDCSDADFSDVWSEKALRLGLAVQPDGFAFGTYRNVTVAVLVEVLVHEPALDLGAWDRVVQGGFEVVGEALMVCGPSDQRDAAPRVPVECGAYRFVVCSAGLETISADGLDGSDHYLVNLWPGAVVPTTAVKLG